MKLKITAFLLLSTIILFLFLDSHSVIQAAQPAAAPSAVSGSTMPPPPTSTTPEASFKPLEFGDYSSRMDELHQALVNLGYPICNPTGDFSWQTALAVIAFQRANGLSADGIVGPATWAALHSPDARPAPQPETIQTLQFNPPFRLEKSGDGLFYEDKKLLVIFSAQQRLARIDPKGPSIQKIIPLPNLGTAKDPWGKAYPVKFAISDVVRAGNVIWIGGGTHFGAAQAVPAVMAIDPGGKLLAGPFQFGNSDQADFLALAPSGKETLAFYRSDTGEPSLWSLDQKSGLRRKFNLDIRLMYASGSASDGKRIWISLPDQGQVVIPLNPANGVLGAPPGVCGKDLAFDGAWLWVLQDDEIAAYDPVTGQIQAVALASKGFDFRHIAARPNQVAVLAIQYSKPYLLILNY